MAWRRSISTKHRVQGVASLQVDSYPWLSHQLHTARTQGGCSSHCRALFDTFPNTFNFLSHCTVTLEVTHVLSMVHEDDGTVARSWGRRCEKFVVVEVVGFAPSRCSEARAELLRVPQSSANCQSRRSKGAEWGSDE